MSWTEHFNPFHVPRGCRGLNCQLPPSIEPSPLMLCFLFIVGFFLDIYLFLMFLKDQLFLDWLSVKFHNLFFCAICCLFIFFFTPMILRKTDGFSFYKLDWNAIFYRIFRPAWKDVSITSPYGLFLLCVWFHLKFFYWFARFYSEIWLDRYTYLLVCKKRLRNVFGVVLPNGYHHILLSA